jgi:alpha-galactosidase/6-phospho-beta-glucosidase family protein
MAPRIAIVGGGSYQWVPKLLVDVANTASLHGAEIVIEDIDPAPVPRMVELVEHIARVRQIPLRAIGTTDQQEALDGADFVVVSISTGGFRSMRLDLEIPARYGIRQSVGDTVGPGGISRALRNIPVLLGVARDMEALCPDAWLLNLTNPMTTLCRAVTRETSVRTVGLCHELTISHFILSLLLDASFLDMDMVVAGVNHLPIITELRIGDANGFATLSELLERGDEALDEPLSMDLPDGVLDGAPSRGPKWTKGDLIAHNRVKLELYQRFGVLPGAGDRHLVEFFAGFLTEESGWGDRWGVRLTSIEDRERDQAGHVRDFERDLRSGVVSEWPSGELVAPLIDSLSTGTLRTLPLNLPNQGQVADLPPEVTVEAMCLADDRGVAGRDRAALPPFLAEHLRRVSASQELTVDAALAGDRGKVTEALLSDPLAGRIDFGRLAQMADDLVHATGPWLPQFP